MEPKPQGPDSSLPQYSTLKDAEGHIEARPNQHERLEEFTAALASGDLHRPTTTIDLVCCMDGRLDSGSTPIEPSAAGGTETLMVADDLTVKRFAGPDNSTLTAYSNILDFLESQECVIGGHDDEHADTEKSGCGANDNLAKIYDFIARKSPIIRDLALLIDVGADDATHDMITHNARSRTDFSKSTDLLDVLNRHQNAVVQHLQGDHKEVALVLNTRPGTTLDRQAVVDVFGPEYAAFNVDVWAFEEAAKIISRTNEEFDQQLVAMVYFNLAAAHVLGGKNLRVIVL